MLRQQVSSFSCYSWTQLEQEKGNKMAMEIVKKGHNLQNSNTWLHL